MNGDGEWQSWRIDGRAGAKLCLGAVFLGEIAFPHDLGCGPRWKAWLNHEHLGYFKNETEARNRIEREILKRVRLAWPAWTQFRHARRKAPSIRPAGVVAFADVVRARAKVA
ncbi:MAG: hypothetical protein JO056_13620 [Alphaproteobacteria bacterium]|nr:hypothetical protein [Alphaproteobacteria bacterium]